MDLVKLISAAEVERVLTYEKLIPQMEDALRKFSVKSVVQPVRSVIHVNKQNGFLGVMPAYSPEDNSLATKLVTFYPGNKGIPTHNALIVIFNAENGLPKMLMDGEVITTMRTAAVSAVATKYLSCKEPQKLAILGAGVQARSHYRALTTLFSFKEVTVWTRTFASAEKLACEIGAMACKTAEEAVKGADVIVTVTSSSTPVLKREWVKPGAHVNAVGACRPDWHEIDPDLMNSATLYVDSEEAAVKESGDVIMAKATIYGELGQVVAGVKEAQRDKTTVFKSLGLAIEDVLSAKLVKDLLQ